jgi:hypothetical protein
MYEYQPIDLAKAVSSKKQICYSFRAEMAVGLDAATSSWPAAVIGDQPKSVQSIVLLFLGHGLLLLGPIILRYGILAAKPVAEVNLRASRRAKRVKLLLRWLAADRAEPARSQAHRVGLGHAS